MIPDQGTEYYLYQYLIDMLAYPYRMNPSPWSALALRMARAKPQHQPPKGVACRVHQPP
jgi:hypothetical protein